MDIAVAALLLFITVDRKVTVQEIVALATRPAMKLG
jgi:hypothetical protein